MIKEAVENQNLKEVSKWIGEHDYNGYYECFNNNTILNFSLNLKADRVIDFLLKRNIDVNKFGPNADYPIFNLLDNYWMNSELLIEYIKKFSNKKCNFSILSEESGDSVLQTICALCDNNVVKEAIRYIKDIDMRDSEGATALMNVLVMDRFDIVELLIKHGADVNITDYEGNHSLFFALKSNHSSRLLKLLIDNGAQTDKLNNDGMTVLMDAVYWKNTDNLRILIENGADLNQKGRNGNTALMIATENNLNEMIKILLEYNVKI